MRVCRHHAAHALLWASRRNGAAAARWSLARGMHMGGDHIWGGALSREVELGGKRTEETRAAELARLRGSEVLGAPCSGAVNGG